MPPPGIRTTDERIQRIEAMHQSGLDQEVERPVHRRRRGIAVVAAKAIEYVVCTYGTVTFPDEFQNSTPQGGKAKTAIATKPFGGGQRSLDATVVIVMRRRQLSIVASHRRN